LEEGNIKVDNETRKSIFMVASCLLGYPGADEFWNTVREADEFVKSLPSSSAVRAMRKGIRLFLKSDSNEIERHYCREFDFRDATSLYLTAHEFGESRKRGSAMTELRRMYLQGGFIESDTDSLPDYIPRLLEFLAVIPDELEASAIEARLRIVCAQILEHLETNTPWSFLFYALLKTLPREEKVIPEDERFPLHEEADLDELPYPLYYE
jgi:nitrate reductase molybdenum cofactor assembly chaperone NarJ/NarW